MNVGKKSFKKDWSFPAGAGTDAEAISTRKLRAVILTKLLPFSLRAFMHREDIDRVKHHKQQSDELVSSYKEVPARQ